MENSYDAGLTHIAFALTILVIAMVFPAAAVLISHSIVIGTIVGFTVSICIFVLVFIYMNQVPRHETR